jgi:hypothetical protein
MHAVGGTSIHYWAQSWRLNPWDFKVSARLPDAMARRESLGARPSRTGRLVWTRSSTSSASPGRPATSRGAGIYSRDLACEYPMPPLRGTEFTELMAVTARKLGRHPFAGPAAIDSQGYDDRPGCMYHGFLQLWRVSRQREKFDRRQHDPKAVAAGRLKVETLATTRRVTVRESPESSMSRAARSIFSRLMSYCSPAAPTRTSGSCSSRSRKRSPNSLSNNGREVGKH